MEEIFGDIADGEDPGVCLLSEYDHCLDELVFEDVAEAENGILALADHRSAMADIGDPWADIAGVDWSVDV
jgi:hypothetical protein